MSNTVPRPLPIDPDGTFDSRYLLKNDPTARGPQGPEGPQGPPGPKGDKGDTGDPAQAVTIKYLAYTLENLPPATGEELGVGALVGLNPPRALYVVALFGGSTKLWAQIGTVTAGPKGDQGDTGPQGPPGPQPPLAGSGTATTAARSDHHHDGQYSPATHKHDEDYAAKGLEGKIANVTGQAPGAGATSPPVTGVNHLILHDGIELDNSVGGAAIFSIDWTKVARASHDHAGAYVRYVSDGTTTVNPAGSILVDSATMVVSQPTSGRANVAVKPNVFADKIHQHSISDMPSLQPALNNKANLSHSHSAADITSGILNKARIPNQTIQEIFAVNKNLGGSASALRVGPGHAHAALAASVGNASVFDTGMRQTTDTVWGYIFHHSWGFGWIEASRL